MSAHETTSQPHLTVTKGHGTRNDFVLIADADGRTVGPLRPELVRALADRRAGVGSDGVIRVVRTETAIKEGSIAELPPGESAPEWFMDYWNADGTTSEMCGNGVRVFVAYLLREKLATAPFALHTRAGVKTAEVDQQGWVKVGMGKFALRPELGESVAVAGLNAAVDGQALATISVDMGNPHTVTLVAPEQDLRQIDLTRTPEVQPKPVAGSNIEFVLVDEVTEARGRLTMRVHERGVGETEACGTGACASAIAAHFQLQNTSQVAPVTWDVTMPGGTVEITIEPDGTTTLAGPAEIVGTIELDAHWLRERGL